nr:reverse transcriptase domain-containing protein [Tanacetum cinerariifolium]
MQTRSSSRLVSNPSSNPTPSTNPNPKGRNRRRSKQRIEEFNLEELSPPIVLMADQRTMDQLLQAPTESYEDAIVVPAITADNFELKHGLLTLVQNKQFFGHDKEDPHAHIQYFNKITSTLKFPNVSNTISPDVVELKDMVKALLLDKKIQKPSSCYRKSSRGKLSITTRSGVSYDGPQIPPSPSFLPKVVENEPEVTKDTVHLTNNESTEDVQPPVVQSESPILTSEPVNSPIIEPVASPIELNFKISFADALILMPKFGPSIKSYLTNKDKLCELARTPLNEHCSAVLLKKLPEKLGDPGKFLIPCDFLKKAECLALADLSTSINLMPLSMWNKLSLPDLSPTCMTLELADRLISRPVEVVEDVYVKVGTFHFPADFVVIDFDVDPRVPLILGRSFLKTERALIDVFKGKLTLRVGKEAITFNLDQTSRYSANYNDMTTKRIDVIDMACEEYSQEVLGFSDVIPSGNPTPYYDSIVSTTSSTLTPFENSDFLLEEVDAFLALEDDLTSPEVDQSYLDSEGDILLLEAFLNDDPSLSPPNQGNYLPEVRKELKICEAKSNKSLIDEPPEVELKDLPPHLEYAFLEGDDKLPVIIVKDLKDFEPTVQHQRRVNPKIYNVIKQEVLKLLDAGLIYPISDTPWASPVHCVPKRGGFTVVENEDNELILTRLVTGWRVCIDYHHAGFYRRFIKDFSKIARPMTRLLKKDTPFHFSKECVEAFQTLKRKLTEAPILIAPDWDMPFEPMCDASDFAIGAVLGQHQDKIFRPIHYASKTMTEAESNYTTTEKEMLAVVYAFEKFRSYLIMNKSIVYMDHYALKYLFAKKDSKARLLCWVLLLQESTFKVIDIKGAENLATDHLSRLENPHQNVIDPKEINESFHLETLNLVSTLGENRTSWSDKLDDALWAFRTAYKTPIWCTPYKLVYGKACHLPIELEHKAYWALKHENFNLQTAGDHKKIQLNELNELRDQAYENYLIYKEKTKRLHDSKIKDRVFNIGNRVLLFNSRLKILSGKLKSRWSGPFTISYVYSYGTVELSQPDGPNFKVNGHRVKHYFGEDVPKVVVPDLQTFPKDH